MTVHALCLAGCSPTPLAAYLKGLAVLRLVAEQRDPSARGWWKDEAFWFASSLDWAALVEFFVSEYAPTPILSPWNSGSGFYRREGKSKRKDPTTGKLVKTGVRDQETTATRTLAELLAATDPRLRRYQECAHVAADLVSTLGLEEAPGEEAKARLVAALRVRLPQTGLSWLDAAVTSTGDAFGWAPLLGTGANDGNEDFGANFLRRLLALFARGGDGIALRGCLYGGPTLGAREQVAGQLWPAGNGGANAGPGFDGEACASEWDYVLALEGAVLLGGTAARRLDGARAAGSFPFAVQVDPIGYPSASYGERKATRFETWMPLWNEPASIDELRRVLAEGRARVDRRDAASSTDVARAMLSLGTSRGLSAFQRTAFVQRNGKMHYGASAGRWQTRETPGPSHLRDISPWLDRLRDLAMEDGAPARLRVGVTALDEAVLRACREPAGTTRWATVLVAAGDCEVGLAQSAVRGVNLARLLVPPLSVKWLRAADDGSPEWRLAVALASQDVALRVRGATIYGSVRAHWLPLDRAFAARRPFGVRSEARFAVQGERLAENPDVVCTGDDLDRCCIALLRRRSQLASSLAVPGLGMFGRAGVQAGLADVMGFLRGDVDGRRVLALARPLMAVDWSATGIPAIAHTPSSEIADAAYAVLRLVHLSEPLRRGADLLEVPVDPESFTRLAAGDLGKATAIALRRLRATGLMPVVRAFAGDAAFARRLAASLAFPLRPDDVRRCADLVTKPFELEEATHGH